MTDKITRTHRAIFTAEHWGTEASVSGIRRGLRSPCHWPVWRQPPSVLAYVLLVEMFAIGGITASVTSSTATAAWLSPQSLTGSESVVAYVVATLLVVASLVQTEADRATLVRYRASFDQSHPFNFLNVFCFSGALLLPPALFIPLTILVHFYFWRRVSQVRSPLYRWVFSVSTVVLSACAAHAVVVYLGRANPVNVTDLDPVVHLGPLLATIVGSIPVLVPAAVVYTTINQVLVIIVGALADPSASLRELLGNREENLMELVTLGIGATTAVLIMVSPALIVFVPAPLILLQHMTVLGQIRKAADIDVKTGLLSPGAWRRSVEATLKTSPGLFARLPSKHGGSAPRMTSRTAIGLIMCDLDHFKKINDAYGHVAGDQVLRRVGEVLRTSVRKNDIVGKFGGEEFLVLLRHPTDRDIEAEAVAEVAARSAPDPTTDSSPDPLTTIARTAERIRSAIATADIEIDTPDGPLTLHKVTISVGAVALPPDCTMGELDALMIAADNAMYEAKRGGRNRVMIDRRSSRVRRRRTGDRTQPADDLPTDRMDLPTTPPGIPTISDR